MSINTFTFLSEHEQLMDTLLNSPGILNLFLIWCLLWYFVKLASQSVYMKPYRDYENLQVPEFLQSSCVEFQITWKRKGHGHMFALCSILQYFVSAVSIRKSKGLAEIPLLLLFKGRWTLLLANYSYYVKEGKCLSQASVA